MARAATLVVVNPRSANGATGRRWPQLEAAIRERAGPLDVVHTRAPGDATERTREALGAGGVETVVSVGGDGTHNEVLNGFFEDGAGDPVSPATALAVVSSGTGGDFRRTLGQPRSLPGSVAHLVGGELRTLDVGRMTCRDLDGGEVRRMFLNIASFGSSGEIDLHVNRTTKALGGTASFLIGSVRGLASYRNKAVRLQVDGGPPEPHRVLVVAVANGRYFGGGMMVAPEARPDDGRLDLVVMGDIRGRGLRKVLGIHRGTHVRAPGVEVRRVARVEAESDERVLIDLDGEMPGRLPATFEVVPGALRVRAPARGS